MRLFLIYLAMVVITGCGQRIQETDQPSKMPNSQHEPTAPNRAELSTEGWPKTTKKHTGEFVYIAPDGEEHALSLGDDTVATISSVVNQGTADEMAYTLQYIRHHNGLDFYEIAYQTGPYHRTTVGPFGYSGREMPIGNKGDYGSFMLRPVSP